MEQALQSNPIPDAGIAAMQPAWTSAIERHRAGDTDGAIVLYQRHLKRNPQDAPGWMNLGAALRRTGRADAALVCYQRALRLRPDDAAVWGNLGNLWRQLGEHEQSLRCHRRALQLAPAHPRLHLECAVSLREAGRFAEAEDIIEQCLAREPGRPDLLCERALLRLHTGRYAEAWPDYEARLRGAVARLPRVDAPRWQGECIGGKRLLLQAEPGMADTLWAARFVAMLARRGADITLRCAAALHPVLAGMPVHLAPIRDGAAPVGTPDMHCPLLSLPGIVDPRGITIPDPWALRSRRIRARSCASHRTLCPLFPYRRGVVGRGRQRDDARASLPLERLLPLASLPGAQVFSLQKGHAARAAQRGGGGFRRRPGRAVPPLRRHRGSAGADGPRGRLRQRGGATRRLHGQAGARAAGVQPPLDLRHARRFHAVVSTMRLLRQKSPGDWSSVCTELLRLVGRWAEIRAVVSGFSRTIVRMNSDPTDGRRLCAATQCAQRPLV